MTNVLANIFGSSPVMPLEKHVDVAYKCTRQLVDFFAATTSGGWEKAAEVRAEIERLEHTADDMKKEIRLHLPKSLFMPVPREDLLVAAGAGSHGESHPRCFGNRAWSKDGDSGSHQG